MVRDTPDAESAATIVRAVVRLGRRLRAERPAGSVSLSELGILGSLHRLGPLPAAELAEAERLKPQSLTRLIADLEARGFIKRRRGKIDRRQLIIEITAGGRGALAHDMAARRAWLAGAMKRTLTPDEQQVLAQAAELMLRLTVESQPDTDGKDDDE
jgi:DNA-binding MarR family transcriptional regulator